MTKTVIGIDISKLTIDVCVQETTGNAVVYGRWLAEGGIFRTNFETKHTLQI